MAFQKSFFYLPQSIYHTELRVSRRITKTVIVLMDFDFL